MSTPEPDFSHAIRWELPELSVRVKPPPSVQEIESIEKAARDEGYAQGHAQGHAEGNAQGMAEAKKITVQLEALLNGFARPAAQLDSEVEALILDMAVRIAGSLLGQAYISDPHLLGQLVEQCLEVLGNQRRNVEVRLHPTDLAVVKPLVTLPDGVKLLPDPTLARADVRCQTDSMRIDATLASRLHTALLALQTDNDESS